MNIINMYIAERFVESIPLGLLMVIPSFIFLSISCKVFSGNLPNWKIFLLSFFVCIFTSAFYNIYYNFVNGGNNGAFKQIFLISISFPIILGAALTSKKTK